MARVTVNGEMREVDAGITLKTLIENLEIDPQTVVALLNGDIVERDSFGAINIAGDESVELVRFVPGG